MVFIIQISCLFLLGFAGVVHAKGEAEELVIKMGIDAWFLTINTVFELAREPGATDATIAEKILEKILPQSMGLNVLITFVGKTPGNGGLQVNLAVAEFRRKAEDRLNKGLDREDTAAKEYNKVYELLYTTKDAPESTLASANYVKSRTLLTAEKYAKARIFKALNTDGVPQVGSWTVPTYTLSEVEPFLRLAGVASN